MPRCLANRLIFMLAHGVVGEEFDSLGVGALTKKFAYALHMHDGIVDGGDDGDSYPNRFFGFEQSFEIFEDALVSNTCILLVYLGIDVLDVVEEEIGVGHDALEVLKRHVSRGVDRSVDVALLACR